MSFSPRVFALVSFYVCVLSLYLIAFLVFAFVVVFASSCRVCPVIVSCCLCFVFVSSVSCGHILFWPDRRRRSRLERALPQRSCLVLIRVSRLVLSHLILPSLVLPFFFCPYISCLISSILPSLVVPCLLFSLYLCLYMSKLA